MTRKHTKGYVGKRAREPSAPGRITPIDYSVTCRCCAGSTRWCLRKASARPKIADDSRQLAQIVFPVNGCRSYMAVDVLNGPPLEGSVANVQRRRAFSVAALIIFLFSFWLGVQAPIGIMSATDELLTAERTREMLMTEPLFVHFNFERSFEKPPLQYWLTSLT